VADKSARLGSTSDETTALEVAIEVALERREILRALREALQAGDTEEALRVAYTLTGLVDWPSKASYISR